VSSADQCAARSGSYGASVANAVGYEAYVLFIHRDDVVPMLIISACYRLGARFSAALYCSASRVVCSMIYMMMVAVHGGA
jgi:hypothetical protein